MPDVRPCRFPSLLLKLLLGHSGKPWPFRSTLQGGLQVRPKLRHRTSPWSQGLTWGVSNDTSAPKKHFPKRPQCILNGSAAGIGVADLHRMLRDPGIDFFIKRDLSKRAI